ncbi:hypothetical protein [Prosthecomicrobium pneumaticum]|uniref:Uncharacterized protein n=1 Tax=Prosthecomicrobium pneumaticum TaxID=81895 RepID=A0A7W9L270_9HYPH|nr:hypothetical protein [Prosthecomicrobium pneumaticum]MBB5753262.1 hypothetical protein [Prosthecomicrobium pneumaticum]
MAARPRPAPLAPLQNDRPATGPALFAGGPVPIRIGFLVALTLELSLLGAVVALVGVVVGV